jgi:type II restriction enzyme
MSKVTDAQTILASLGLPPAQQNEQSAYTLLAIASVRRRTPWREAKRRSIRIHDILTFIAEAYGKTYAENTRETIRRQAIHQFEQARIVDRNPDDPTLSTNSPRTHYALTEDALVALRVFGATGFFAAAAAFTARHGALLDVYQAAHTHRMIPVILPSGKSLRLSPGKHNALQVAVITDFAPRFLPGAMVLYVGDTSNKTLHVEVAELDRLGVSVTEHDKLPDVVFHFPSRGWLVFVEAVTSHGPVSPKRHHELEAVLARSPLTRVYGERLSRFRRV